MRRVVILRHECREFANRLLNRLRIEAFAQETNRTLIDYSRFEYTPVLKHMHRSLVSIFLRLMRPKSLVWWHVAEPLTLAPTMPVPQKFKEAFEKFDTLYFAGWSFRNPEGMKKHREKLLASFTFSKKALHTAEEILTAYEGRVRIGMYQKKKPYPYFPNGDFLVSTKRVQEILTEYVTRHELSETHIGVVVVTDEMDPETALAVLSQCSVVIGTNETLPHLAAWRGNVPHVVTTHAPIDWEYYRNQTTYFENKYASLVVGLHGND